ncbi:MAG: MerR family transcriptional regulator [Candidatus Limnocylindrales bacterium]
MRIGKLAQATGLSTHALRYYEREGLLPKRYVQRLENNYREYSDAAIERIAQVGVLTSAGFSLSEARDLLSRWDKGRLTSDDGRALLEAKAAALDARIRELQMARDVLMQMREHLQDVEGHGVE